MSETDSISVSDVTEETLWYAACCAQVDQGTETQQAARLHEDWMRKTLTRRGMYTKVALDGDQPIGFIFALPIGRTAWYIAGDDLLTIQCLNVEERYRGRGVGEQLLIAVEETARPRAKGLAVIAYDPSDWFMPASFFRGQGYQEVERRGTSVLMFKPFVENAPAPSFVPRQ